MQPITHVVARDGVRLHVQEQGDRAGRPMVFANPLGSELRVWDALLPHLPAGYRFVRWDKRGHGLSDAPPPPYTIGDHVADFGAVLDALGVREQAVVVGLSIGGMIAQGIAAARPELPAALMLLDTGHKIGTPEIWAERIAAIEAGGVEAIADAALERWFPPAYRAAEPRIALWRNMLTRTTLAGYVGSCAAIRDADLTDVARAIAAPTLCLTGSEDLSTPPPVARALAALIPGAEVVVMEGVGHIPCLQAPEALAALMTDFLARHGLA